MAASAMIGEGMRCRIFAVIALVLLAFDVSTAASAWPDRSIKIIVPFVAGGSSDTLARILAEGLRDKLGQTVVVENRGGGGGVIGMSAVAGAPADGYTLLAGHIGTHAITPAITPPVGYDPARTFVTVAVPATSANAMVVRADSKINSLDDLIKAARSKPSALNYGSPGVGSPSHIAVVQLAALSGIEVTHVAYRGNAAAVTDMLNGTLDFMFGSPAEVLELVRSGKFKALATTGESRSRATPDIPAVAETVKGYEFRTWHVMSVRADTTPEIIEQVRKAATEIVASDDFRKKLDELGLDAGLANGAEAEKFVQAEIVRWGTFVKASGIKAE
jgi:tripartite-type tricarboxylate transporter receptor subunit TctC